MVKLSLLTFFVIMAATVPGVAGTLVINQGSEGGRKLMLSLDAPLAVEVFEGDADTGTLLYSGNEVTDAVGQFPDCATVDYSLYLYTANHLMLVAVPATEDEQNCPTVLFDSVSNLPTRKVAAAIDDTTEQKLLEHSIKVVDSNLQEIFGAFDGAQLTTDGEYDAVLNNCADLPFQMLSDLGAFESDEKYTEVLDFVSNQLYKHGKFLEMLKGNKNLKKFLGAKAEGMNDKDLLKTFVFEYAKKQKDKLKKNVGRVRGRHV